MSKVLVTGGAGFIGSNLTDRLMADGHEVIILDNLETGKEENLNPAAQFIKCDIADYESIAPHFAGVEAVFHCAALARIQPSIDNPLQYNESNITGTLNVLWAARNAGVKKVVYSASSSAYGRDEDVALSEDMDPQPGSPYALQKLVGEMYSQLFAKLYNLPTVILRYFNVYGPRQITEGAYAAVIGIFLQQRGQNKPMTIVGDGTQRRDFTHVDDVVAANILAWQKEGLSGEVINVGSSQNYTINEIAAFIGGERVNVPKRPGEYQTTLANNTKAEKLLGWRPRRQLPEAIAELKKLHGLL